MMRSSEGTRWCGWQAYIVLLLLVLPSFIRADTCRIDLVGPENGGMAPDTRPAADPFTAHSSDLSIPLPTQLTWTAQGDCGPNGYCVHIGEQPWPGALHLAAANCILQQLPVWNLKNGTTYYWQVTAVDSAAVLYASPICSFRIPAVWPRMVRIDGTSNARDIGGCINRLGRTIRQGRLYRSAELYPNFQVTALGLMQVRDLGIAAEIDLRGSGEDSTRVLPADIRYHRPCGTTGYMYGYWYGLQNCAPIYLAVFQELARRENYPLLLHCWAGMDRTGTVAALLEAMLDYTDQQIALDYQWSSLSVNGTRGDTLSAYWTEWNDLLTGLKAYDPAGGTLPQGARNYLQAIGLTAAEIDSIRSIFLEPAGTGISSAAPGPATAGARSRARVAKYLPLVQPLAAEDRSGSGTVYSITGRTIYTGPLANLPAHIGAHHGLVFILKD
jgi:hypothetical protein